MTVGIVVYLELTHCSRKIDTHWLTIRAGECVQSSKPIRYKQFLSMFMWLYNERDGCKKVLSAS